MTFFGSICQITDDQQARRAVLPKADFEVHAIGPDVQETPLFQAALGHALYTSCQILTSVIVLDESPAA